MTRIRALTYCCISFVCGMLIVFATWQMGVMHGSILRGAQAVADERDFWSAMEAKVPCERNGYKFCPNTETKEVLVVKRKGRTVKK